MITLRNTQRTVPIKQRQIKEWAKSILKLVAFEGFDVTIWLTTNATIRRYNAAYRNKDKATDILSFPFFELKPGEHPQTAVDEERILGDIIISVPRVLKDAQELEVSFEERMKVLLIHGICHLIGYDHETDEDHALM